MKDIYQGVLPASWSFSLLKYPAQTKEKAIKEI